MTDHSHHDSIKGLPTLIRVAWLPVHTSHFSPRAWFAGHGNSCLDSSGVQPVKAIPQARRSACQLTYRSQNSHSAGAWRIWGSQCGNCPISKSGARGSIFLYTDSHPIRHYTMPLPLVDAAEVSRIL